MVVDNKINLRPNRSMERSGARADHNGSKPPSCLENA